MHQIRKNKGEISDHEPVSPECLAEFARERLEWLETWETTYHSMRSYREAVLMRFIFRFALMDPRLYPNMMAGRQKRPVFSQSDIDEIYETQKISLPIREKLRTMFVTMIGDHSTDESQDGNEPLLKMVV